MTGERRFQVKLARSSREFTIPEDSSIVEVLHENGIDHPVSCEQGICGTCIVKVLDGDPDHRDEILTDSDRNEVGEFTPCCSRSFSDVLVLDI